MDPQERTELVELVNEANTVEEGDWLAGWQAQSIIKITFTFS